MTTDSLQQSYCEAQITVEDTYCKDICTVDFQTPIALLKLILEYHHLRWIFPTTKDRIVGALHRNTLLAAMHYQEPTISIGALIETIPKLVQLNAPASTFDSQSFVHTPLWLVQSPLGDVIGFYDKEAWMLHRHVHMLTKRKQSLLSDPTIRKVSQCSTEPVYIIGGWVRDFLMGQPCLDLDFAIEGDPIELAYTLARTHGGQVHRFTAFGGAHWVASERQTIDITETRKEEYETLGALPIVTPTDIFADLGRRDFTINAIAIAVHKSKRGLILDPFGGLQDLENGILRSLHGLSFLQDPTRIFRASRYSSRFDMSIEEATLNQIQSAVPLIKPGEMLTLTRIGIELDKIFMEPAPSKCWQKLCEWGVWGQWNLAWSDLILLSKTTLPYSFEAKDWQNAWWMQLRWALSNDVADWWKDTISIRSHGLKLWTQFPTQLQTMVTRLQDIAAEAPHWKRQVGDALHKSTPVHWLLLEQILPACIPMLNWWISTGRSLHRKSTGADILALGIPKGPQIAKLLVYAQHIAWEGGTKEDELTEIQTKITESNI